MKIEYRSITGANDVSVAEGIISGLAIPYNRETMIGEKPYGFREKIAPGSCTKSISERDVVCLLNHNADMPLARTAAGNLTLNTTDRGVEPVARPTDTSYARDLAENVKAGVVRGWSFGFEVVKDDWFDDDGEPATSLDGTQRVIREMKLIEVSAVTFPAYAMTDISARDAASAAREGRGGSGEDSPGSTGSTGAKPYGNVKYADPGYQADKKKRYPVDTKAHVKAGWAFINKAKNAAKYTAEQVANIKATIKAAAKKYGVAINEQNASQLAYQWRKLANDYADLLERDAGDPMQEGTAKRVAQIVALLNEAMSCVKKADTKSLPDNLAGLISSALTHVEHIQNHEDIPDAADQKSAGDPSETRTPKPDETTSENTSGNAALVKRFGRIASRSVELGYLLNLSPDQESENDNGEDE